jgi:hypothetical protein
MRQEVVLSRLTSQTMYNQVYKMLRRRRKGRHLVNINVEFLQARGAQASGSATSHSTIHALKNLEPTRVTSKHSVQP